MVASLLLFNPKSPRWIFYEMLLKKGRNIYSYE